MAHCQILIIHPWIESGGQHARSLHELYEPRVVRTRWRPLLIHRWMAAASGRPRLVRYSRAGRL